MLAYNETPVQEISVYPGLQEAGVRLLIKREDLNHPTISGNKWWKLKYNLEEARALGHTSILTFGGAYSNHIYATASAAKEAGFRSIGIIRGERTLPLNKTLQFATAQGMHLEYVDRHSYRNKTASSFIQEIRNRWGDPYVIPEGGTNHLAVEGCAEFGKKLQNSDARYICLPVGTGGTMAGIIRGVSLNQTVIGFPVLQNGGFLQPVIADLANARHDAPPWKLMTEFAYGGYGKRNETVSVFIEQFLQHTNIPLDFVYTGKMMCGILELIRNGYFKRGETILAIHTGGLQGHS